jgi:membrane protease YdiL (CAAX protease family)
MPAAASEPRSPRDLAVVLVALVLPTAITWLYFFEASTWSKESQLGVFSVVKTVQFALPIVWVWIVQRTRPSLRRPGSGGVGIGFAFGAAVACVMFAMYWGALRGSDFIASATPAIRAKVTGAGLNSLTAYAAVGVFYSLFHSLLEEYYWRWFVYGQLRRWTSLFTANVISSLGFMAHHVLVLGFYFGFTNPATYVLASCIAVGGAAWAWLYQRNGSLLGPWLSHMLVDAAIFAIGYDLVRDTFTRV